MGKVLFSLVIFMATSASAYPVGQFECLSSSPTGSSRTVLIRNVDVGGGQAVPYLEVSWEIKGEGATKPIKTSVVRGIGDVSQVGNREIISVGALKLDFRDDVLQNCRQ